jgi:hypothetical protein
MISKKFIILISIFYGYLVGVGLYGFSNDYYFEYYQSNLIYPKFYDKLGSLLSTLTIFNTHIGVYITSFVLALSSGFLLRSFFVELKKKSLFAFTFIFLVTLHIHPVIMSTSGAMRQGWAMSFIFFSIIMFLSGKNKLSFLFIFLSIFTHKSGLIFFTFYISAHCISYLLQKIKKKKNNIIFLNLVGITIFLGSYLILLSTEWTFNFHRIVAGDFRLSWLIINIFYLIFYFLTFNNKLPLKIKHLCLFLYVHACSVPAFLYLGLNWQYERVNMISAILLILVISSFFKKSFYLYLSLAMCTYLFLTIYQGMYLIGLT